MGTLFICICNVALNVFRSLEFTQVINPLYANMTDSAVVEKGSSKYGTTNTKNRAGKQSKSATRSGQLKAFRIRVLKCHSITSFCEQHVERVRWKFVLQPNAS